MSDLVMALPPDKLRPVIDLASTTDGFLRVMDNDQRALFFEQMRSWYCEHCGAPMRDRMLRCACVAGGELAHRERVAELINKLQAELGIS